MNDPVVAEKLKELEQSTLQAEIDSINRNIKDLLATLSERDSLLAYMRLSKRRYELLAQKTDKMLSIYEAC